MYSAISRKLASDAVVIIDGGTGTEIQNRGVPMNGETWCAEANLTHPDVVRGVHADYVDAGAELIIANTFATSPLLFEHLGRTPEVASIDRAALELARQAAGGRVPVAGSFSTMRPVQKGTDRTSRQQRWSKPAAIDLFRRKADGLAEAGADLIVMEMMRDADYSLWATEAAVATGLPVWVGLSVEAGPDGDLRGFGRPDCRLEDFLAPLSETGADVLAIMHSSPERYDPDHPHREGAMERPALLLSRKRLFHHARLAVRRYHPAARTRGACEKLGRARCSDHRRMLRDRS